jgi:hypothetical protein
MKASATIKKKSAVINEKKKAPKTNKKDDCNCDHKDKKKDKKNKKETVSEGKVNILKFSDFLNESEDFQNQFIPGQGGEKDEEEEELMLDGPEDEADDIEDDEEGLAGDEDETDTWNIGDEFDSDEDSEPESITDEPGLPKKDGSKIGKLNSELASVNLEIGKLLDRYKADRDIESYKMEAGPFLAKRKELQAQMDKMMNIGLEDEEDEFSFEEESTF